MDPNPSAPQSIVRRKHIVFRELSYRIVAAFFDVYNQLGYGFLESIYAGALAIALTRAGLRVEREVPVPISYRGVEIGLHCLDMLVEKCIIIEIKSTERLSDVPKRQVRNYLSATSLELGLLLHFGPTAQYHRILRPATGRIVAR